MNKNRLIPLIVLIILIGACSSGKKQLYKGNYDRSVLQSVSRLRSSPNSSKARESLATSYPLAKDWHLGNITSYKTGNDVLKWERVAAEYAALNNLYNQIQRCPACREVVSGVGNYPRELDEAKLKAAEVRYGLGEKSLALGGKLDARDAYYHYIKANELRPGFKDVNQKIDEARFMATTKVLVDRIPIHSATLQISNDFFQDQIQNFLVRQDLSEFVRFYTVDEAQKINLQNPDHLIVMRFDEFVVGSHYVKETKEKLTRDSVEITIGSGETAQTAYITVKAEMTTFRKEVKSSGLLDFRVIDNVTNKLLYSDKLPGTYIWFCEWGFFNGDERALTKKQLKRTKGKELMPPPPQQLFIEFTKPIYNQITGNIRGFYRNY